MYSNNDDKKQKTNHLASRVDKQANKGKTLPRHLSNKFELLQQYTVEVRRVLAQVLPSESLQTCWVVDVTEEHITISVSSTTLANHLRYMSGQYIHLFYTNSELLRDIRSIKSIVSHTRNA